MKKLLAIALALMLLALPTMVLADGELTLGSWRTEDGEAVGALLAKYEGGIGPDLFYSRTYSTGAELSENGFNVYCEDIPGVKENFTETALEGFTDKDGHIFAVPFAAVSHFVYYNKQIFADNGIEVPTTFEEFLAVCETLKAAGITPLANGIAGQWDILECVLCSMVPNYITAEERVAYETGEKKLNDEVWLKIYEDFAKLVPYLPESFASIDEEQADMIFTLGQAAMVIDGSWSYSTVSDGVDAGFFSFPAPEGYAAGFSLHPDFGIAGNAASEHPEEVKAFLEWLASPEGAKIAAEVIPAGFLPLINADVAPEGSIISEMNAVGEGKNADRRFVWNMMALYTPIVDQLNAICNGEQTPAGAVDAINAVWEGELAK